MSSSLSQQAAVSALDKVAPGNKLTTVLASDAVTQATSIAAVAAQTTCASADEASIVAEMTQKVRLGRLALEKEYESAAKPMRQALDVVRGWIKPKVDSLKAAEETLKKVWATWQTQETLRAQRQRDEQQRLANEAAAQAALESAAFGAPEDEPPPAVMAPARAERVSRGGGGAMLYTTERLTFVEVVDWAELAQNAPQLLKVDGSAAVALFRSAEMAGTLDTSKPLTLYGMRFEMKKGTASR